jgi:hypothetical protein
MDEVGKLYLTIGDFGSYYAAHYKALNIRATTSGAFPNSNWLRVNQLVDLGKLRITEMTLLL